MRPTTLLPLLAASLLAACASTPPAREAPPGPTPVMQGSQSTARRAVVHLTAASGTLVSGTLTLVPRGRMLHLTGDIGGLAAGSSHGFHIHQTGDCSAADASSAGGHFNPTGALHGKPETGVHHAGDIDNLVADAAGVAHVDTLLHGVSLGGGAPDDIAGRAIVVHAAPDDYRSQPAGNSGARVACGVIVVQP